MQEGNVQQQPSSEPTAPQPSGAAPPVVATQTSAVAAPAATTEPSAASPAQLPTADPFTHLSQLTNGSVSDEASLRGVLARAQEAETLRQQLERAPKMANALAEKVNDLFSKGSTPAEVQRFLEFQSIDVGGMAPVDAIKMAAKLQMPELASDAAMLDAHLERLGLSGATDSAQVAGSGSLRLAIAQEHKKAVDFLAQQKVAAEQPPSVANAAAQAAEAARVEAEWQQHITAAAASLSEPQKVQIPIVLDGRDDTFFFDFKMPDTVSIGGKDVPLSKAVSDMVGAEMRRTGIAPTAENAPVAKQLASFFSRVLTMEAREKAIAQTAAADAVAYMAAKLAGPKPTHTVPPVQQFTQK